MLLIDDILGNGATTMALQNLCDQERSGRHLHGKQKTHGSLSSRVSGFARWVLRLLVQAFSWRRLGRRLKLCFHQITVPP